METRSWTLPILVVLGLGAGAWELHHAGALSALAPAEAHAETPASRAAPGIRAEGRLVAYPGAEIVVGTDLGGTLRSMKVEERAHVKKGQLLAEIDGDEARAAVAEAQARVGLSDVEIRLASAEADRAESLLKATSVSQAVFDRAARDRDAAKAQRTVAVATASRLATSLAKTRITAPIDGVVLERRANAGETVPPGASLLTIADLSRTRVEAELDEFDVARVAIGAEATLRIEGRPGSWHGKVEEIPDAVVSRRLKPLDPGRPTDTRVLLVKIALTDALPAKLGQRVEIEIHSP